MNLLILIIKILSLFYQLVHTRLMRCFLRHLAQRLSSADITPFYWIITLTTGKPFLRPQLLNWGVQNPTSRLSHTSICLYGLHNGWMGKKSLNLAFESAKTKAANTQSLWLAPGKIHWISKIKLSSIVHLLIAEIFLHDNWPFYKIYYRENDFFDGSHFEIKSTSTKHLLLKSDLRQLSQCVNKI